MIELATIVSQRNQKATPLVLVSLGEFWPFGNIKILTRAFGNIKILSFYESNLSVAGTQGQFF